MKALSIRQPSAHLILEGLKKIEYRSWPTDHRGPLLIHTGRRKDPLEEFTKRQRAAIPDDLPTGCFLGVVDLISVRCVCDPDTFEIGYEWRLANPRRIKPVAALGKLNLFEVPDSIARLAA